MANENDQRILLLRKKIVDKKEKLKKIKKFTPVTNCSIEVDGNRYNINVLTKEKILTLMIKLNAYLLSAKDLEIDSNYTISGFHLEEWLTDLKNRLNVLSVKDEEQALKAMESKLTTLLSDGKKVELEIDEIESLLK
jgi:hypothetical protein